MIRFCRMPRQHNFAALLPPELRKGQLTRLPFFPLFPRPAGRREISPVLSRKKYAIFFRMNEPFISSEATIWVKTGFQTQRKGVDAHGGI
jgi:hypothetical protein